MKAANGTNARLNGDGQSVPVAERRTAWGMAISRTTMKIWNAKTDTAKRKANCLRNETCEGRNIQLCHIQPPAIAMSNNQMSWGLSIIDENCPNPHRMPSLESKERTPSVWVAERSHEIRTSNISDNTSSSNSLVNSFFIIYDLLFVGFQVVNVNNT